MLRGTHRSPQPRERTRTSAGPQLCPHDLLLLVCNGEADAAEQGVQVAPGVGGQAAVQTGRSVQLTLLLPAGLQELLLGGAQPLQGLPAGARRWARLRRAAPTPWIPPGTPRCLWAASRRVAGRCPRAVRHFQGLAQGEFLETLHVLGHVASAAAPAPAPGRTYLSFLAAFSLTATWMMMGKAPILCRARTLSRRTSRRAWVFWGEEGE